MSCISTRVIAVDRQEPERVECIRGTGHVPSTRHRGFLEDGSSIEWDGAPCEATFTGGLT